MTDFVRRNVINTVLGYFLLDPEPGAITDLRTHSPALERIGATLLPAFAIATSAAPMIVGRTIGNVTVKNARSGEAPRSRALLTTA